MSKAAILSAGVATLWGIVLFLGCTALIGGTQQAVEGFPSREQFYYYLLTPAVVVSILVLSLIAANYGKLGTLALTCITTVAALFLLPFMMFFTGGM